jgi:hypothetical protein
MATDAFSHWVCASMTVQFFLRFDFFGENFKLSWKRYRSQKVRLFEPCYSTVDGESSVCMGNLFFWVLFSFNFCLIRCCQHCWPSHGRKSSWEASSWSRSVSFFQTEVSSSVSRQISRTNQRSDIWWTHPTSLSRFVYHYIGFSKQVMIAGTDSKRVRLRWIHDKVAMERII